MVPADDQAMVFPWASVMVIMVLLNVAFTCATPEAMFLRSRRRTRVASLPILDPLAARRCIAGPIAGAVRAQPPLHRLREFKCHSGALLLLAGNRPGRSLAGAGIGMGALATDR